MGSHRDNDYSWWLWFMVEWLCNSRVASQWLLEECLIVVEQRALRLHQLSGDA